MMNFEEHHQAYCQATGLTLRYMPLEHDSDWYLWAKYYDLSDLKTVVDHLRIKYKDRPDILKNTLMFRHLIRCRDFFGEYLAEAMVEKNRAPSSRQQVLSEARMQMKKDPVPINSMQSILEGSGLIPASGTPSPIPQEKEASAPALSPETKSWLEEHAAWKSRMKKKAL